MKICWLVVIHLYHHSFSDINHHYHETMLCDSPPGLLDCWYCAHLVTLNTYLLTFLGTIEDGMWSDHCSSSF